MLPHIMIVQIYIAVFEYYSKWTLVVDTGGGHKVAIRRFRQSRAGERMASEGLVPVVGIALIDA